VFERDTGWRWRPDLITSEGRHPVINIRHGEAEAYCAWLSEQTGQRYRLPAEAEWEYACRAGTTTRFWSGDEEEDLARVGWYAGNSGEELHRVAEKPANAFGLHDMHGLVFEWIADRYGSYPATAQTDPWGTPGSGGRVLRGGSYWVGARWARSAFRAFGNPRFVLEVRGFRVALPAAPSAGA
jgi:formylglycine-generating enzyme required for sulfatase activity